jgi:hypothetical protein
MVSSDHVGFRAAFSGSVVAAESVMVLAGILRNVGEAFQSVMVGGRLLPA